MLNVRVSLIKYIHIYCISLALSCATQWRYRILPECRSRVIPCTYNERIKIIAFSVEKKNNNNQDRICYVCESVFARMISSMAKIVSGVASILITYQT